MGMEDFVTPMASFENQRRSTSLSLCNTFVYTMLREEPMKLSVRKLDGSFFDVEIMKSATIAELKLAVKYVFSQMRDQGTGEISWPHVWGHFCLCYERQKLVSDTDHVAIYGINDGDQLHFVSHVSSIYDMTKNRSKKSFARKLQYMSKSSSRPNSTLKSEDDDEEADAYDDDMVYGRFYSLKKNHSLNYNENESPKIQHECQFPFFRRNWYSYSRMSSIKRRTRSNKGITSQSEYNCGLLVKLRNMILMWDCSKNASKGTSRED